MAFQFARSTLDTAALRAEDAYAKLREELAAGLSEGEALAALTGRVQQIFRDPQRALAVAQTEASRAAHAGGLLAARESGVVTGRTWLASSDSCDVCQGLDGTTVGLDEPYGTFGRGPYAAVMHPPAHPFCMCTETFEVG